MTLKVVRRPVLLIALSLLVLSQGMPRVLATHSSLEPLVWATDSFVEAPQGFLGCLRVDGSDTKYCFVVDRVKQPSDQCPSGDCVHFVTQLFEPPEWGPSLTEPEIFESWEPSESMYTVPGYWDLSLVMEADVDGVGIIDLTVIAGADGRNHLSGRECIGNPLVYELAAKEFDIITEVYQIGGTIAETPAHNWNCSTYFVGPTSGAWFMPTGA